MKPTHTLRSFLISSIVFASSPLLHANPYYWDSNDAAAGFGNTTGTWGTSAFWSTNATGEAATANSTITTADTVNFGTATLNYANATVTGPATAQGFLNMNFGLGQTTALTLSGGNLTLAVASTITQNSASTMTINSVLQDSGSSLTKTGTGTLALSGANTYTGNTTVQQGKLSVSSSTGFASTNISISSGATFSFANTSGVLPYHNAVNNAISGAGTLMKEGAGTVDLSANGRGTTISLSSGALIDIQGGILRNGGFQNANWTNNLADLNIGSLGTFDTWNGAPMRVDAITGSGTIINGLNNFTTSLTFGVDNGSGTFSGTITAVGLSLVKDGSGTQTLSGNNSYTGTTTVNAGTLALSGNNTNTGTTTVSAGTLALNSNLALRNSALVTTGAGGITLGAGVTTPTFGGLSGVTGNLSTIITSGYNTVTSLTLNPLSGSVTYGGVIANGAAGMNLIKTGAGTQILGGANTYTGNTTVQQGKLSVTSSTGFASPNISISSGATFSFANTSGALEYNNATNNTISGAGTLMKEGAGEVNISANGKGTTIGLSSGALIDIQGGTLRNGGFANANWTNNLADLNIGLSGTFDTWNGAPIRVDAITGSGRIINGLGSFTTSLTFGVDNGSGTFSGIISAVGLSLVKDGSGTQTLSGNNTYTGTTTVSAGTLSASNIVVSAGSSNLGNAASAVTLGAASTQGTLSYTGNNATYTRGFNIGGAGGGRLDVTTSGQTLQVNTGNVTGSGLFTVGGAGNTTINVNLTHTGGLTKADAGTLTLSGTNSYTGATNINAGTLVINGNQSSATGNVSVTGILAGNGGNIGGNTTINAGGRLAMGDGTAKSIGTGTFSGTLAFAATSIFEWDLNAPNTNQAGSNQGSYDKVVNNNATKMSGTSIFNVVLGTGDTFGDAFWDTDKTWTDIFSGTGLATNLSAIFTSFNGTGIVNNAGVGEVAGRGSFSFNSTNTLTWTAVPEPTSALAGLLITAGLLRRRRSNVE